MRELPRISVITPSFNTGRHIAAAVKSVLEQDYPNFDYLVLDGGSTDNTLDVLRAFDDRVRWISQKDNGQAEAIHRGFQQAKGDILCWLNSDDTYAPGAFRAVAEFFASNPDVALVYGDARFTDADGSLIGPCVHVEPYDPRRLLYYSDFIVQPAAFFRRSAYDAVGGLDPTLHWGMDYDLWVKIARRFKIAYLPCHLANYRWLAENKTSTGGFERLDEVTRLFARHGLPQPAYIRLERVNLHAREALHYLRRGSIGPCVSSMARAAATVLGSRRAIWSMLHPRTWRIIWMGQVLRAKAAKAQRRDPVDRFLPGVAH